MGSFILPQDYSPLITDEQLDQITQEQSDIDICLAHSEEEIKEYLRHRFDVQADMLEVIPVVLAAGITCVVGARYYHLVNDGQHYHCIQDATSENLTDPAFFTAEDNRNQKLVQVTIDVFLYHLHTRLNPRNIPVHRMVRYDGQGDIKNAMSAVHWLMQIQKGTITPDLTTLKDEDGENLETGQSIIYGSSPPLSRGRSRGNSPLTGN